MTDTIKTLLLAVVQGLTEFLPVSSSGHLVLAQRFLGVESPGPDLEIFLHLGTLASICAFYRKRLGELIRSFLRGERAGLLYAGWVLVSMVPAGVVYALARDPVKRIYETPRAVAALLVANGAMLLLTALADRRRGAPASGGALSWARALAMGVGQAIAVLPGISRSGTSISAGRLLGVGPKEAAEFSFVMSIPVIVGAALLELRGSSGAAEEGLPVPIPVALASAALAALVGYFALKAVVRVLHGGRFWMFGLYCLATGALALAFA